MAETQLALAVAVPRRGVEIADAGGVRRLDGGGRLRLRQADAHVAEGRAAHAELRDLQPRLADLAPNERVHVMLPLRLCSPQASRTGRPGLRAFLHPRGGARLLGRARAV